MTPEENSAEATVERTWQAEPELASPAPRTLVSRARERWSRRLFCTLALVIPGVLAYIGITSQQTLAKLKDHGATTVGKVVERRPPQKNSNPQLVYEYQVDGAAYRVSESRVRGDWDATLLGAAAPVRYLPESPGKAYTERELQNSGSTPAVAWACWFVAAILFLTSGPCWLYIEKKFGRVRDLARTGLPTAGVVTAIDRFGPSNYDQWRVKYALAGADQSIREGKAYLYGSDVKKLGGVGATATVLVDPSDDRRYELYAVVKSLYFLPHAAGG
jgi:hypothetical protein